jgi:hypothetical protein
VDGSPIPEATGATYTASSAGVHTYNCKVQGFGCPDFVFDPTGVSVTWQSHPAFAGLTSVTNAMSGTCTLDLAWSAAATSCPGGVTYSVYRSTSSPVAVIPANRIASGIATTTYADSDGLTGGTTYYYVVRAVAVDTGEEDANTVERSGSPTGTTAVVFSDTFESGNLGWTFAKGTPAAITGDFLIGDPVGTAGNYGQACQPEDDHTTAPGVACLYTAPNSSGSPGADDVDDGEVIATSPVINLSGFSAATLSLWRWFENEDVDDSGDYYVLEVSNDGSTWVQLEQLPDTVITTNNWANVHFDLQEFVGLTATMRIRIRVADGTAVGDLVEFAADDIVITGYQGCTPGASGPPPVGDGAGGTQPMLLTKGSGDQIHITVDNTSCRGDHVAVLAGALGNFSGYQWAPAGCAFASGGAGTGTIIEHNPNVWFIAVWVTSDGIAGNPGDSSSGGRTWSAAGYCSVSGDDPGDLVCN